MEITEGPTTQWVYKQSILVGTPYFVDGKFICHLSARTPDNYGDNGYWKARLAERLSNLRKNGGEFLRFSCPGEAETPFEFLEWVREKGYTLQQFRSFFREYEGNNFVDFHGSVREAHGSFMFRIYDMDMVRELREMVETFPYTTIVFDEGDDDEF